MSVIGDRSHTPTMEELIDSVNGKGNALLRSFSQWVEKMFSAKSVIEYSVCKAKPGWNFKYRQKGKSLCTVYPDKTFFTILVVLREPELALFEVTRSDYSDTVAELVDRTRLFNNTKWLMLSVTDERILRDAESLITLKTNPLQQQRESI